uniref:Uncharacterized protein n=1 Tax=Digenea simplex TaxID=945030 RepID=A0A1Z1MTT3_DIGSM|nr:hypothetical protein [Digenea simplex]ARW69498.1 hypothetical protein [Digenea simplex]
MNDNYCLIRTYTSKIIEFRYYFINNFMNNEYRYPICFTISFINLNQLFYILSLCSVFDNLSTRHKLYIGKELFKASISVNLKQHYIQE